MYESVRKKILIADTDVFLTRIYAQRLEAEGFFVDTAHDGEEAWKTLAGARFDLALLEIMLPGMDAFRLLKRVRSELPLANVSIIFFTNATSPHHVEQALKLGASDYIVKAHYTPFEVVSRIRRVLVI